MKYAILNDRVELSYSLYKIIFLNSPSLKFSFIDMRETMGDLPKQTGLMIYSKEKKYKPWFGVVLSNLISNSSRYQAPGYIFGLDNIEKFLKELKEKSRNYNVDDVLDEVLLAKQEKITFFGK